MSRSHVEDPGDALSYGMKLANRSFTADQIRRALLDHDTTKMIQSTGGFDAADRFARRTEAKALELVRQVPKTDHKIQVVVRVVELRDAADEVPWPGRSGPTDRRVLEGAFLTATLCRSSRFNMAIRTWALRVGMPKSTVASSVRRLVDRQVLGIERRGNDAFSTCYRLRRVPNGRNRDSRTLPGDSIWSGSCHPARTESLWRILAHDAFRSTALGDDGWMLVRWLHVREERPVPALVATTGMERHRIYGVLGELQGADIAHKRPSGWVRVDDDVLRHRLDRIAAEAGTAGMLERQREVYETERAEHRRKKGDRDPNITVPVPTTPDIAILLGNVAALALHEEEQA